MALITNQVLAPGAFLSSLPIVEGQPLIVGGDDAFVTRVMEDLTVTWIVTMYTNTSVISHGSDHLELSIVRDTTIQNELLMYRTRHARLDVVLVA